MGAHFALYATTQMNNKFYGVILHDVAVVPNKKAKLTKEQIKIIDSYLPKGNSEYAKMLRIPTFLIQTVWIYFIFY